MALSVSLLLAAGGAILVWGIEPEAGGVDLHIIGWIALAAGAAGIVLALSVYARDRGRRQRVVRRHYPLER